MDGAVSGLRLRARKYSEPARFYHRISPYSTVHTPYPHTKCVGGMARDCARIKTEGTMVG